MELVINIPDGYYKLLKDGYVPLDISKYLRNGKPLTPKVLADLLIEERIRGELKRDVSYSKDVIDDVRCRLTVDIIDRRPCYCGAELRAVWRERKESTE